MHEESESTGEGAKGRVDAENAREEAADEDEELEWQGFHWEVGKEGCTNHDGKSEIIRRSKNPSEAML